MTNMLQKSGNKGSSLALVWCVGGGAHLCLHIHAHVHMYTRVHTYTHVLIQVVYNDTLITWLTYNTAGCHTHTLYCIST